MPQRFCAIFFVLVLTLLSKSKPLERLRQIFVAFSKKLKFGLRLGAQSVTLLSTLRDPTQLRRHQCATRQQHPFFVAHQKEGIGQPKKVQHHIGGGQQQNNVRNPLNSRIWVRSIPSF